MAERDKTEVSDLKVRATSEPPVFVSERPKKKSFEPISGEFDGTVELGAAPPSLATPDDAPSANQIPEGSAHRSRFVDQGELGHGGMGAVLSAFDRVLLRDVAMKVIHPEADTTSAHRFLEEAQITAQLEHPNIVPVHDLGAEDEQQGWFFAMKRISGMTLSERLKQLKGARPSHDELRGLLRILLKICDALEFAHGRGVVHCDLKPDNIMVGPFGQVYLMDWGVCLLKSSQHAVQGHDGAAAGSTDARANANWVVVPAAAAKAQGTILGTPSYMAPEQALGLVHEIDERTDVFGMGAVLHAVLIGKGPHQGANPMAVLSSAVLGEAAPMNESELWQALPPGLCAIATKALSKERADRQQSIAEFRHDIERFLDGGGWFATREFAIGDVIVAEGERADTAYIIESGRCRVCRASERGEQELLTQLGPGQVFGETAALSTGVRTASVIAATEVTVREVTRESLEHELERNPWVSAFVRALADRFRESEARARRRP